MPSSSSPTGRVFHLVTAVADRPTTTSSSAGLARDQFERHGFVHCCFREQLVELASWWFDPADALVVVELDPAHLTAELRLEPSPTRWYPHLYGPVDATAVVARHTIPAGTSRALPSALADPPPGYQLTGRIDGTERTVRWHADGTLDGDRTWIERTRAAIEGGHSVELVGDIVVPATLERAYESFAVLESVTDDRDIVRYDGDGFF
ncbi:MAG TPA: DUF952 domain-containing protein [Acidimicrobiales bacterium]|nr:DUF952 domain-containing protein [Acidimicrobiales bacterium]